jgi:hypothetical protein
MAVPDRRWPSVRSARVPSESFRRKAAVWHAAMQRFFYTRIAGRKALAITGDGTIYEGSCMPASVPTSASVLGVRIASMSHAL